MKLLSNMSISAKIYAAVLTLIVALVSTSGFAIWQIRGIGHEVESIAEQDIPLTSMITKVVTHQLEQSIQFERALKFALEQDLSPHALDHYKSAKKDFRKYGDLVNTEVVEAEVLAQNGIDHAYDAAAKAEFTKVLNDLKRIEQEHKVFEEHVAAAFAAIDDGNLKLGIRLGDEIDAEIEKLDREVEALLTEINEFTAAAALTAEHHEKALESWLIMITVVVTLTVGGAVIYVVQVSVPAPLQRVLTTIERLVDGQLETPVEAEGASEIRKILTGLEDFRVKLAENAKLSKEVEVNQRQTVERSEKIAEINREFDAQVKHVLGSVDEATRQLNNASETMTEASDMTQSESQEILGTSETSSRNMQSVGSATEELTASIGEIARQTDMANSMVQTAVTNAGSAVSQTKELVENARSIGDVLDLISGIADQTNLLALNATIEAARAGEAGKGFAVVASEVKALANQTQRATSEIREKIEQMQTVTSETASAIEGVMTTISEINDITGSIAGSVNEQSGAVQEIGVNVSDAVSGAEMIVSRITSVSGAANRTGSSSKDVDGAVKQLEAETGRLRNEIDGFLNAVRAA